MEQQHFQEASGQAQEKQNQKVGSATMSYTKEEADALAAQIRGYWRSRGEDVVVEVYPVGFVNQQVWGIRSNLCNGFPTGGPVHNPHKSVPRIKLSDFMTPIDYDKINVRKAFSVLGNTSCHATQIAKLLDLSYVRVMQALAALERDREVVSLGNGRTRRWMIIKERN